MPSVSVKLYSVFFKILLKHKLQSRLQVDDGGAAVADGFGVTSRPEENSAPANPSFGADGVATKDIHIDPLTSLAIRIFLPDPASQRASAAPRQSPDLKRRNSYGGSAAAALTDHARRSSYDGHGSAHDNGRGVASAETSIYRGYLPSVSDAHCRSGCWKKFPVIIQFHGGGFSTGSNTSKANDIFRRRMAKLCGAIVIAVGYSLAPESRYPAAFEDGVKVLHWLGKQARLAECRMAMTAVNGAVDEARKTQLDTFGVSTVEPLIL